MTERSILPPCDLIKILPFDSDENFGIDPPMGSEKSGLPVLWDRMRLGWTKEGNWFGHLG